MYRITSALAAMAVGVCAAAFAPGAAAAGWKKCATEPQPCHSTQAWSQVVRFGLSSGKNYLEKVLAQGKKEIGCDRASFGGDPAPYKRKSCWIWEYDWTKCATELNLCKLPSGVTNTQVRFGTTPHKDGKYIQKTVKREIRCDRPSFGGDPVPYKGKSCWYWDTPR